MSRSSQGSLEAAVMDVLWRQTEPVSVRQVLEQLQQQRTIAYTTVMTVMDRLFQKGLLQREERGQAFWYSASQSRADYTARMMTDLLGDDSERTAALVHFADHVSPDEAQALWEALDARRARRWRRATD